MRWIENKEKITKFKRKIRRQKGRLNEEKNENKIENVYK